MQHSNKLAHPKKAANELQAANRPQSTNKLQIGREPKASRISGIFEILQQILKH
jgi:hypothetical protein